MSGHSQRLSSAILRPSAGQRAGRVVLILLALIFLAGFLVLPVVAVFTQALSQGWRMYRDSVRQEDVLSALRLTGLVALIAAVSPREHAETVERVTQDENTTAAK